MARTSNFEIARFCLSIAIIAWISCFVCSSFFYMCNMQSKNPQFTIHSDLKMSSFDHPVNAVMTENLKLELFFCSVTTIKNKRKSIWFNSNKNCRKLIKIMLLMAGIESNPGPTTVSPLDLSKSFNDILNKTEDPRIKECVRAYDLSVISSQITRNFNKFNKDCLIQTALFLKVKDHDKLKKDRIDS